MCNVPKIYNGIVDSQALLKNFRVVLIGVKINMKGFEKIKDNLFSSFKNKKKSKNDEEENYDEMLCRFVLDGSGNTVGESIAVNKDENVMIIKSDKIYLGVPLKHIEKKGKTLLVKGLVEHDKAIMMGERWRKESYLEIKHTKESE